MSNENNTNKLKRNFFIILSFLFLLYFVVKWGTIEDVRRRNKANNISDSVYLSYEAHKKLRQYGISRFGVYTKFYYGFYVIKFYTNDKLENNGEIKKIITMMNKGERIVCFFYYTTNMNYLPRLVQNSDGANTLPSAK